MLIKSFGLFWRASEILWNPGKGKKGTFRLLGRQGQNHPGVRLVDVRWMQGIYILYGDHGAYYDVGLTRKQGLGKRLGDHQSDEHAGQWDRFSWFGFQKVLKNKGLRELGALATIRKGAIHSTIGDIEALLIKAMGVRNKAAPKFADASEWTQVALHEVEQYLEKIAPP